VKRGFLLGKFMPPHAGHVALIDAARSLSEELTVLVCWLPGDSIPGALRLRWMRELFPDCRVVGHGAPVPQEPAENAEFWSIWRGIVQHAHPEPIDYLFAGEAYGRDLAREVGGRFVPLGGRVLAQAGDPLGSVSATAVRADPARHWPLLPPQVRAHYRRRVYLHGGESTGKSTLAAALARRLRTIWVGEYGRSHCEAHPGPLSREDLLLIGAAQDAMIRAAEPWAGPLLIADTDPLMTAAWCEMLLGDVPRDLLSYPRADLYLLMEPDLTWVDDGTRFFSDEKDRARFAAIAERVLMDIGAPFERVSGTGAARERRALEAIAAFALSHGWPKVEAGEPERE
jgi:NadR type nicotinamide-nucleotide adenylyltransferase